MGSRSLNVTRFEVSGVYTHPDARVDIVLVHGLNGDPVKTWTAKNNVYWPTDLLPASLKGHHANILVYGYNADVFSHGHKGGASDNFIYQHAQTLVSHLTAYRKSEGTSKNPIIWVAHSLGGILVKRALLYSNDIRALNHEPFRSIFVSTYAIIFLGTPHTGSGLATWAHVLQAMSDAIIPKKIFESESVLLKTLKRDNERLQEINSHFLDIYQRFQIHMAHENRTTDIKSTRAFVVAADSASPQLPGVIYYGIEANHSEMCKFDSTNASGYRMVSSAIYDWVEEAPPVIETRWEMETEERNARARYEMNERNRAFIPFSSGDAHSAEIESPEQSVLTSSPTEARNTTTESIVAEEIIPDPEEAPFMHPDPFRPNSYFIGREKELADLHAKLLDGKKREEGTSAVLLHSLPGGGKTHLARQYVFEHRAEYPGGIYWVRSKSITEMELFYWKIAKSDALRDHVQKALQALSATGKNIHHGLQSQDVIEIVRSWFNSFDQWLIVFDGIRFDTPGIHKFIPDAKNTSLIFTSIQQSATGMYEFDNPQLISLGPLSLAEARDLLLEEMEKKKPWNNYDKSRASDLVQLMDRLPLMIHVAARHLKATREPLSKYLRTYKARPPADELPAYHAVYSELVKRGASPALNLISILAFYHQWIPVGMVTLGLGALDNVTPVLTKDVRRKNKSLNNSLRILIAFALVERTETDDVSPSSSQSSARRIFDRGSDSIDVLRIHSVVQAFFVGLINRKKELNFWLERAARVFCTSFDEASKRIEADSKLGLAEDYRWFKLHGRRLLEHLARAQKKVKAGTEESTALEQLRKDVETKLSLCQEAIDRLSEAAQKNMTTGSVLADNDSSGEVSLISVFERANSLSESDSASQSSQLSLVMAGLSSRTGTDFHGSDVGSWKGKGPAEDRWVANAFDGSAMQIEDSPIPLYPQQMSDENPYHWHVPYLPYPAHGETIPVPTSREDTDDQQTLVGTPRTAMDLRHPGVRFRSGSSSSDWGSLSMAHRTIRRNESRRYHDRAGSWRDNAVSDPRTTVSRKIARGSMFMSEGGVPEKNTEVLSQISEAEAALNKIKAAAPVKEAQSLPVEEGTEAHNDHKQRTQSMGSLESRPNSLESPKEEGTSFTYGLFKMLSGSQTSTWTTSTLQRIKENILPPQATTASSSAAKPPPPPNEAAEPLSSSISSLLNRHPSPMFRGTRSAQSSPSPRHGPFNPPPLPDDDNMRVQPDLPVSMRPWATQTIYSTGRTHLDSSDLSFGIMDDDPMAATYPMPAPARRPPYQHTTHQTFLHPGPNIEGYTSQPMSRNASSQSQPEAEGSRSTRIPSSRTSTHPRWNFEEPGHSQSHSLPINYRPGRPAFALMMPSGRQRSPVSWVETEPSPRREDVFGDVHTSYRRWEEKHGQGRSGSGTATGPSTTGVSRVSTFGRRETATDSRVYTSEPMARSGSGGIQLSDGRIVPFGQAPRRMPDDVEMGQEGSGGSAIAGLGISREDLSVEKDN